MIHGIIAYPVTPFADTGIDTARLAALVDKLVAAGVHAVAPLGSTGELAYLEEPEFDSVVDTTIATVAGRVPVVVGVSDVTTAKTVRRAGYAQRAGATAVMVLPVSYWKLTEREILEHYRRVGEAVDIPIMAYNNPATSGVDMRPELLVTMFETIDNFTMVKESTGELSRMLRIAELSGGRLPFYNGSNPLVLDALSAGAAGWCTAAPCLRPQPCIDLYDAVRAGDLDTARTRYNELKDLLEFIVAGGLATTIKAGLQLLGTPAGDPRPPLLPFDEQGADLDDAYAANTLFDLWVANRRVYGVRKLWHAAKRAGHDWGRDRVWRLMRIAGIDGVVRGKPTTRTTERDEQATTRHPDLIDRAWSTPTRPDHWWVADFTYVWTLQGFCYAAFCVDVFSRRILGCRVLSSKTTVLVTSVLEQALFTRRYSSFRFTATGLVRHSDAGSQYTAIAFTEALREAGIAG